MGIMGVMKPSLRRNSTICYHLLPFATPISKTQEFGSTNIENEQNIGIFGRRIGFRQNASHERQTLFSPIFVRKKGFSHPKAGFFR